MKKKSRKLAGNQKKQQSVRRAKVLSPSQQTEPLIRRKATIMSPLRYPGGKRRLAAFIAEVLKLNKLRPKLFVEPFAGGASVALQLLNDGHVEAIVLGEKDPLIASFWKIVFNDPEWLIRRIRRVKPTLKGWDYYKYREFTDDYSRAFACLYLNRTSFSGILAPGAGPIGGRKQVSKYKIDCRFNAEPIIRRIKQVARLREKVLLVKEGCWRQTINEVQQRWPDEREVFYYFDPPFYKKAAQLYRHYFADKDHVELRDYLAGLKQSWVLSYDPEPKIIELYSNHDGGSKNVRLLYSASGNGELQEKQELIVSNLPCMPTVDRLWRSSDEWKK